MLRVDVQVGSAGDSVDQIALNASIKSLTEQLMALPFAAREPLIESFSALLLRGIVPISGLSVQQPILADQGYLEQLNDVMQKNDAFRNGVDARYVYQFAREATSAGILPAYKNSVTGELYIALICNKRNLQMYNWSAGYTEAPLPTWRGKLLAEQERPIYYDRLKIKTSATATMEKILNEAGGDWTRVDYDFSVFEEAFSKDGVQLPKIDINSLHTASRESIEEISLDLTAYPNRKVFLISHDNTVGISQGDAPGQTSNRSHQYLVYLGVFDVPPPIKPGDDVAIADWINVSEIERRSSVAYFANHKPLCIYMLRSIELGLKDLWNYLLAQESTRVSRYTRNQVVHFSCPANLAARIEEFCERSQINIENTSVSFFLRFLSGELSFKTYTGKLASQLLDCMLQCTNYLLSGGARPERFMQDMTAILCEFEKSAREYNRLFPVDYYTDILSIFNRLPEKHAEKQAEAKQQEIAQRILSGTPYMDFYRIFMRLNEHYGPNGDYASAYEGDAAFIRCRYPNIFTRRQTEFSGGVSLDTKIQAVEFKPGSVYPGVYPAAKIPLYDHSSDEFVVLGEGPYEHTFSTLLDRLAEQKVSVLIAVGPTEESGKEKYYNYMRHAQEITAAEYLLSVTNAPDVPDEFRDSQSTGLLKLKFYRYVRPENQDVFHIMHMPSWVDLGMPVLTEADKLMLAYDAEYGGSRYYHCSAGVGRSVALIMLRMAYELIFKAHLDFSQATQQFETMLKKIKQVKPRAGEWWQLLLALGLAEDMHKQMSARLAFKQAQTVGGTVSDLIPEIKQLHPAMQGDLFNQNVTLFAQFYQQHLAEHKHTHPAWQREFDKRFGLIVCKK